MTDQNTVYRGDYDTQPEEDDPLAELARIVSGDVPANSSNPNVGQPAPRPQNTASEPQISTSDFASALAEELDPPPAAGSPEPSLSREAEPSLEDQLLNEMGQGASPDPIAGTAPNPAPGPAVALQQGAQAEPAAMMSRATPTVPQDAQPEAPATPPPAEPAGDADAALARLEAVAKSLTGEPADFADGASAAVEQSTPRQSTAPDELDGISPGNSLIDQQTAQPDGMGDAEADLESGFAEVFAAELGLEDTGEATSGDGAAKDQGEPADPIENHFADAFAQELAIDAAGEAPSIVPGIDDSGIDDGGVHHDATLNEGGFDTRAETAPAADAEQAASRTSGPNRGFRLAVGALIVALLVGTGVVAWGTFTDTGPGADGEPPVIRADSEPAKVKPEDPGGRVIANQENQVYERVAGGQGTENNTQEELITSREQPVDVAGKTASRLSPDSAGDASPAPLGLPPKKVRTLVVKPDGTIVSNGEPATVNATAGSAPSSQTAQTLALAQPGAAQEGAGSGAQETAEPAVIALDGAQSTGGFAIPTPSPLPAPVQQAAAPAPKPETPQPAAQTPQPAAQSDSQSDLGAPTQIASAPASPQPAAARPAVTSSEWKIQVSSQRSRGAAESSFDNIKRRFSSILGDRTAAIERADIEGKGTFYRVKVLASSRKDATDICGRLKSAGGSCFVTR